MNIKINNVSKYIKGIQILDNVSLEFTSSKVYGLRGINGSGKTMLMRVISGLIFPSSGEVIVDGKTLGKDISSPKNTGILIENPAFLDNYTAYRNLKLIADIKKIADEKRINEVIEKVGLNPKDKRKYKQFSLGMKQRLGIAGAILEYPDLLLIDEPTNALDSDGIEMLKSVILEEKQSGALIILACHDFEILKELSDEIYLIENGKVQSYD